MLVLQIRDVYAPDPKFLHPGSRFKKISGSQICIKELKNFLIQKNVSKLLEI